MFVIGTAGHVDHGKSALVQALTGIDPDRLQEEKDRGMTIDLGFAWLALGEDEVSIVDVPGHERFIKNMLAGAGGIDLALLVVAADEGVMPQTREHLAILDLLGVERGVVALTKRDLVDSDWLDLVAADVEETLEGTTLEHAPIVACSSRTGEGLPELLAALRTALSEIPPKRDLGRPRLPIDRAFSVAGFGTVVTGTLIDGTLDVGDEIEVLPAVVGGHLTSLRSRVRGLQSHRQRVERALPGTRTAINLAGIDVGQVYRGQVVARPGWLRPSFAADVRLRALASLPRPIRHNLTVSFHSGSSESQARLRLLDRDELPAGEEAWAQLRLARPVALVRGDYFVIRDANDTIGGGVVVETQARRHPRRRSAVIEDLERRSLGSPADDLLATLRQRQPAERDAVIAASELGLEAASAALAELLDQGRAVEVKAPDSPAFLFTAEALAALAHRARAQAESFQKEHPLRRGMAKEELRSRLDAAPRLFPALLHHFMAAGILVDHGPAVSTPDWAPRPSAKDQAMAQAYLAVLRANPYSPPAESRPSPELIAFLEDAGEAVDVGGGVVFAAEAYREMVERIVQRLRTDGAITLAGVRDLFGTSRRYAQALLEHLDQRRITVRRGDERILGRAADSAASNVQT